VAITDIASEIFIFFSRNGLTSEILYWLWINYCFIKSGICRL